MSIELNLPYTIKGVKKSFEHGDKAIGFLKTSNCMCYLAGLKELAEELKKDSRLDPGLDKELERLIAQIIGLSIKLMAFAQTKKVPE